MTVTIYHNPRCSKSRETLGLLQSKGVDPVIVEYLDNPPTAKELSRILGLLGVAPRDFMRKKEAAEAGLDDPALSDDALIAGLCKNPRAIERPIVLANGKAAIGRPPEKVLEIL